MDAGLLRIYLVLVGPSRTIVRAFTHHQNAQAWKANNAEKYTVIKIEETGLEGE